jgi:hypothetical protein
MFQKLSKLGQDSRQLASGFLICGFAYSHTLFSRLIFVCVSAAVYLQHACTHAKHAKTHSDSLTHSLCLYLFIYLSHSPTTRERVCVYVPLHVLPLLGAYTPTHTHTHTCSLTHIQKKRHVIRSQAEEKGVGPQQGLKFWPRMAFKLQPKGHTISMKECDTQHILHLSPRLRLRLCAPRGKASELRPSSSRGKL